jgi:hypothetical protein
MGFLGIKSKGEKLQQEVQKMRVSAKQLERQAAKAERSAAAARKKALEKFKNSDTESARQEIHAKNQWLKQKRTVESMATKMEIMASKLQGMVQMNQVNHNVEQSLRLMGSVLNQQSLEASTSNMDKMNKCLEDLDTHVQTMLESGDELQPSGDAEMQKEEKEMQELANEAQIDLSINSDGSYSAVPRSRTGSGGAANAQTLEEPQAEAIGEGAESGGEKQQHQQHGGAASAGEGASLDKQEERLNERLERLRKAR